MADLMTAVLEARRSWEDSLGEVHPPYDLAEAHRLALAQMREDMDQTAQVWWAYGVRSGADAWE